MIIDLDNRLLICLHTIQILMSSVDAVENNKTLSLEEKIIEIKKIRQEINNVKEEIDKIKKEIKLLSAHLSN